MRGLKGFTLGLCLTATVACSNQASHPQSSPEPQVGGAEQGGQSGPVEAVPSGETQETSPASESEIQRQSKSKTEGNSFSVLLFSRTTGFRHESIPAGIQALQEIAQQSSFSVFATEDPTFFTEQELTKYQVVVFLNTTGDVLDDTQQNAFEGFIQSGKGFVGIHSASDTEYDWPWYAELVGAYFKTHPAPQKATLVIENAKHPATQHLGEQWLRHDEWYDFRSNPREKVEVLARLDPNSYEGSVSGEDRPAIWYREFDGGRSFYTVGGHTPESFSEPAFRQHLLGAIRWAAGATEASEFRAKATR